MNIKGKKKPGRFFLGKQKQTGQKLFQARAKEYPDLAILVHTFGGVSLVFILAAVLTFLFLDKKSLWLDEVFSVTMAQQDWTTLLRVLSEGEANMGLYYILLKWWVNLGQSEFVVRSLSVLFALATVPMSYALGARLFGSRVGIITALLLTVNAFFIRYAQEARGYSLVLLLVTLSSYFFVKSIERPSRKLWIAYIISSVLAVYAHFFAVMVLLAHTASLGFLRRQDVSWKGLVVSGVIIILLLVPLVIFILSRGNVGLGWIHQPNLYSIYQLFYELVGRGGRLLLVAYLIPCSIAFFLAVRTWLGSKTSLNTWRYTFLLSWLFIPIIVAFSYSFIEPIFWPRFFIICLLPLVLSASVGLCYIRYPWVFATIFIILMVLSGRAVIGWYSGYDKEGGEDWRSATRLVVSMIQPGDTVLFFPPYVSLPFDYYLHRLGSRDKIPDAIYRSSGTYIASRFQKGR